MKKVEIIQPRRKENHGVSFSGFFLTINTQQAIVSKNDPLIRKFHDIILHLVKNIWGFIKVLDGALLTDKTLFPENIKVVPKLEVGNLQKRLHAHLVISLNHKSKIQLDLTKIRNYLRNALGGITTRVDVKIFKKDKNPYENTQTSEYEKVLENYLSK